MIGDPVLIVGIQTIGIIATAVAASVGAYYAYQGKKQSEANHAQGEQNAQAMNGHMAEMLRLKGSAGEAIGQQRERDRVDDRADAERKKD